METTAMLEEEFVALHGGPKIRVGHNTWLLADGACIRADDVRGEAFIDPSREEGHRLRAVVRYRHEHLKPAESALRTYRLAAMQEADPPCPRWEWRDLGPPPQERDEWGGLAFRPALARLEAIVAERRAALESAQRELARVAPDLAQEEMR
jgi:hypothetical protein